MKKAILTFGLFSLMMILTSFTTSEIGGNGNQGSKPSSPPLSLNAEIGGNGNQGSKPSSPPLSYNSFNLEIGGNGNQGSKPSSPPLS